MHKLKQTDIASWREKQKTEQGGKCPLTGWYLGDKCAADHDHKSGMMRATLGGWANSTLGRVENWANRIGGGIPPAQFLRACADYIEYHEQHPSFVFHYLHKTPEEKKLATKVKAAARRKLLKAAQ